MPDLIKETSLVPPAAMERKPQRDATFDIMKGIGILLVLLGHVWSEYIPVTNHIINSFHMPMFFIVAGYFSKPLASWKEVPDTLLGYLRRLIVPMAATQATITLWSALMAVSKDGSWDTAIANALSIFWADAYGPATPFGQLSLGVIWFLMALMVAKSLLLVISRLGGWSLPLSILLSFGAVMLNKVFPYSIWCLTLGLSALPFVGVGWWARNHKIPLWTKLLCVVCWALALRYSALEMYAFKWGCYPLDLLGACGASWLLYLACRWIGRHTRLLARILAYLGIASLSIMCVHGFEIESHLGNHLRALLGFELSEGWMYVWRYALTIALAIGLVHIPKVKHLFVK